MNKRHLFLGLLTSLGMVGVAVGGALKAAPAEAKATSAGGAICYLTPGVWEESGAKYALYYFNDTTTHAWTGWMTLVDDDSNVVYESTVPSGTWTSVVAVRFNSTATTIAWDAEGAATKYVWNQTIDITIADGKNGIQITGWSDITDSTKSSISQYSYPDSSRAENFAGGFISALDASTVCKSDGSTDTASLKTAWDAEAVKFAKIPAAAQTVFKNAVADSAGTTNLVKGAALYDYVYVKYHSTVTLSDFAVRQGGSSASVVAQNNNNSNSGLIVAISALSLGLGGTTFILLRKKKHN